MHRFTWNTNWLTLLLGVAFLCLPGMHHAQVGKLYFQRISLEEGLPQGHIFSISQDSLGFMWFCTGGGLARYDGYEMKVYQTDRQDSTSLPANWVTRSYVDRQSRLWIGTEAGLALYHPRTGRFTRYQHSPEDTTTISDNRIRGITEDSQGRLWVGTVSSVELFDPEQGTFTTVQLTDFKGERHNPYLYEDLEGFIWASSSDGLFKIDPKTLRGQYISLGDAGSRQNMLDFWTTPDTTFWVLSGKGIWANIRGTDQFEKITLAPGWEDISSIAIQPTKQEGIIWIGTKSEGLILYDYFQRKVIRQYTYSAGNPEGLSNKAIYSLYTDRDGNLWIGTFNGVNRINPQAEKFALFQNEEGLDNFANYIIRIYQEPEGRMWTSTMDGIFFADQVEQPAEKILHPDFYAERFNALSGFSTGPDGRTWMILIDHGLYYWDPKDRQTHKSPATIAFVEHAPNMIKHDPLEPKVIWYSNPQGLFRLDTETLQTDSLFPTQIDPHFTSNFVHPFAFDSLGNLWIGSSGGLLYQERASGKFQLFPYQEEDDFCLSPGSIRALCLANGKVYTSTARGIMELDPSTGSCQLFGAEEGLIQENISALTADKKGVIWATTLSYLHAFNPHTKTTTSYHIIHTIKEFNTYTASTNAAGLVSVGGTNGYFCFNPSEVALDTIPPRPVLTGLKVLNEEYPLPTRPEYTRDIYLSYEDKVITFEYAGLQYTRSSANTYRYYLEGFDDDWQSVDTKRDVTYTNLNPGRYTFHLNTANADGFWSKAPLSIDLYIAPPYWQTYWFYALVVLILLTIGFALIRNRQRARALSREKEIAERSARYKSMFLANMSHEIRTPMNAILGISELLRDTPLNDRQKEFAEIIRRSSENLLVIINDILDHSKIESGKYTFAQQPFELRTLIRQLQQIFQLQAQEKSLSLTTQVDENVPNFIEGDQVRLNQILINLLANAIKFTHKGSVELLVKKLESTPSLLLQFEIRDTGVGIEEEVIPQIFESFEQISQEQDVFGTGLGLAITKNLIEQQQGKIWVESTPGKGSSFFFQLPFHLSQEVQPAASQVYPDPANWGQVSILVVEDTPFNQVLAVELLKSKIKGVTVGVADNGLLALEQIHQQHFDLILMDIKMPVMDGYEAARKIRNSTKAHLQTVPIIALTANVTEEHLQKCREVGMNAIITKPIESEALLQKIYQLLNPGNDD